MWIASNPLVSTWNTLHWCCFCGRRCDASNDQVLAKSTRGRVVKTNWINVRVNSTFPDGSQDSPCTTTDLDHCRCHVIIRQRVAVDPHISSSRIDQWVMLPACLSLLPARSTLVAANFPKSFCSIFRSILHLFLCLCSCDICCEITLYLPGSLQLSVRLSWCVLICPPSPRSSRLLQLIISQ